MGSLSTLTAEQRQFWQDYLRYSGAEPGDSIRIFADIAGNDAIADKLLALYLNGKKTAGSTLAAFYQAEGEALPNPGDYWLILDSTKAPRCLVQIVEVETFAFSEVPERVARAEGEGDLSLSFWRKAHREFFSLYIDEWGVTDLDSAEVVVEHYNVLYPEISPRA